MEEQKELDRGEARRQLCTTAMVVYKGVEISRIYDSSHNDDQGIVFMASLPDGTLVNSRKVNDVLANIDALVRRQEDKLRIKVGVDVLVYHQNVWGDGHITSISHDGSINVRVQQKKDKRANVKIPAEAIPVRVVAQSDANKDLLEKLVATEELYAETVKELAKLRKGLKGVDLKPFLELQEAEIEAAKKAAEEEIAKKVIEEEEKAKAKAELERRVSKKFTRRK
uniref:Uncharacterized protein n=1 Tax=viral metagenome TaxID=1070528 RepID=A0A6M3L3M2_9ZZZZ